MDKPKATINPKSKRLVAAPQIKPAWTEKNMHMHPIKRMKLEGGERWERHLEHLRTVGAKNHRPVGVPDGWGRQLDKLAEVREPLRVKAEQKVQQMIEQGLLPSDDDIAKRAVTVLLEIAEGPDAATTKAGAAKALLEFTKQKPVNKHEVKAVAEEWLASLDDNSESTEDQEAIEG